MWGRRIGYGAAVLGCLVLYLYFTQWAAWVLLWWLLCLPVISLLLSLPAMKKVEFTLECPEKITVGTEATVQILVRCTVPMPFYRCKLGIRHMITGEEYTFKPGESLHTQHCGGQEIFIEELRIYDYFGLFSKKIQADQRRILLVTPLPVEMAQLPRSGGDSGVLRPKRGGGFSEEQELRAYVPGDDLRQIHWKVSAKLGSPVVRQPMEQTVNACVIALSLYGSRAELDRKLGRLLWLSSTLVSGGEWHQVEVLTGDGMQRFFVEDGESLREMLEQLLLSPQANNEEPPAFEDGAFTIGGDADGK